VKPFALLTALAIASATSGGTEDPSYAEVLAMAEQLDAESDAAGAVTCLERWSDRFSQDYRYQLSLAWYRRRAGQWRAAVDAYRQSVELSGGAVDARLGLATALSETGELEEAYVIARDLASEYPDRSDVALTHRALRDRRPRRFGGVVFPLAMGFTGHAFKQSAFGVLAGADLRVAGPFSIGVRYRGLWFQSNATQPDFVQHEGWARAGFATRRLEVDLWYGNATVTEFGDFSAHVGGLQTAVNVLGRVGVDASWSVYDDRDVFQFTGRWAVPIGPVWLVPEGSAFVSQGDVTGAGRLTAELVLGRWSLWVRGKGGRENRPVYLGHPSLFNIPESIDYGLGAGGGLGLGDGWSLLAGWEGHHLTSDRDPDAWMSVFNVGVERRL
jgi:hypothetical protein